MHDDDVTAEADDMEERLLGAGEKKFLDTLDALVLPLLNKSSLGSLLSTTRSLLPSSGEGELSFGGGAVDFVNFPDFNVSSKSNNWPMKLKFGDTFGLQRLTKS